MSSDVLVPSISDDSGYCIRERDLRFLRLDDACVEAWRLGAAPLGMSPNQYEGMLTALDEALMNDGVEVAPESCDVRLKGSSANFFSGSHKPLPTSIEQSIDLFRELRGRIPEHFEVEEIRLRFFDQWIADGEFPAQRPFDSLYRLTVSREASDVDLQISNDLIVSRCRDIVTSMGQDPTTLRIAHPTYNFVRKDLVARACPNVRYFSERLSDALGRHVSIAVFPYSGPPDTTAEHGGLSAHKRNSDWRIR